MKKEQKKHNLRKKNNQNAKEILTKKRSRPKDIESEN